MKEIRKIVGIKYHNNKRYLTLNKGVKATIKEYDGSTHEGEANIVIDDTKYKKYDYLLDVGDKIYVDNYVVNNIICHKISLVEEE